jgi:hypothetical protein
MSKICKKCNIDKDINDFYKHKISSAKNEDDIIKLNHYTNLQPLCSKFNRDIKKDKILN